MAVNEAGRKNLKESFAEDMARHQRLQGKLPTPYENQKLAEPIFERVEREMAEEDYRYQPPAKAEKKDRRSLEEKAKDKGFKVWRDQKPDKIVKFSPRDLRTYELLRARVAKLLRCREKGVLGMPSWRDRVLAAIVTFCRDKKRGTQELEAVCDASAVHFGDWRKPPEKPLYFG